MDYKEKAARVCADLRSIRQRVEGGYDEDRSFIGTIEAALQEAAAEAFRDAAKNLFNGDQNDPCWTLRKSLQDGYLRKAAALTPPANKGESI